MGDRQHGPRRATGADLDKGRELLSWRKRAGSTQQALATELGISPQQLSKYEGGRNRIPATRLDVAIALLKRQVAAKQGVDYDATPTDPPRGVSEPDILYETLTVGGPGLAEDWSELEAVLARIKARLLR